MNTRLSNLCPFLKKKKIIRERPSKYENLHSECICREVQEKSQLTIFYGGKVLVFDDFSEDKAREIVNFASRACEALLKQSVVSPVSHVDHPSGASQHNAASFPSTSGCCPPVAEQPSSLAQASGSGELLFSFFPATVLIWLLWFNFDISLGLIFFIKIPFKFI